MYHVYTIRPDGELIECESSTDLSFIERCLANLESMGIDAIWMGW